VIFPPHFRELAWRELDAPLDLLVIGGGITGAGVLHEAALRGLRVGLVEQGDFASGTSSRSSKLIHGGLRYLKRMQLRITRLACRERDLLLGANPHLVWPVRFLYPSFADDSTPGWQVNLGLTMYDHLAPGRHHHERLETGAVAGLVPALATEGLEFGLLYDDAAADDARLVLAVVAAGVAAGGSALNHARVEGLLFDRAGRVEGAAVRDLPTGTVHRVHAAVTVNATGVWCDAVRGLLGSVPARLRPSRGSHLLFPRELLPLDVAVTALAGDDGRPVFCVPHPEGTLVGTTDLFHEGGLDAPRPSADEVAYLLRFVARVFPGRRLGIADVCGAFAGVRPILDSHADEPSEASREEEIWEERGLVSAAGGKLTTYRATAEEVVEAVIGVLPEQRREAFPPAHPASAALPWRAVPARVAAALRHEGVVPDVAAGMARRLGASALLVASTAERKALRPLADGLDLCAAELLFHLRFGAVEHLDDLLLRRVRLGMWQPRVCLELAPRLRSVLRRPAGWGFVRWQAELERVGNAVANWLPPEAA